MKTIVWDVDDVLNDLMRNWLEQWWIPSHADCSIRYDQIRENPPNAVLGISYEEYIASLDEFRLSKIAQRMLPVSEVLAWFRQHGEYFRHMALTSTPMRGAPASAAWVMRHFGLWIRSYNLVPSLRKDESVPVYDLAKEDFLCWLNRADLLVDDNPVNIIGAGEIGIKSVLIPRPWNHGSLSIAETLSEITRMLQ